jgi:hypothetical protein
MTLEVWQAIPAVDKDDLRPILSTLHDRELEEQVAAGLGLTEADSLFSILYTQVRGFEAGRLVVVDSLRPEAIQTKIEADLAEEADARWFTAADFVLRLTEQQSRGCYGGWHKGFALSVFGR